MRFIVAAFATLLALVGATPAPAANGDVALVVGNARYDDLPAVAGADTDARKMAVALRAAGFDVIQVDDMRSSGFQSALDSFGRRLEPSGTAFFYFAGHSIQAGKENMILPVDVRSGKLAAGVRQSISVSDVLGQIKSKAKRIILVLDACRDLPASIGFEEGMKPGCARQNVSAGMLVVLASEPDKTMTEASMLADSFIARALEPGKDINAALAEIRQELSGKSAGGQIIYYNSGLEEAEFTINPGGGTSDTPPVIVTPPPEADPPPDVVTPPPEADPPPDVTTTGVNCDGCPDMAAVEGGVFTMGNSAGGAAEKPPHERSVASFQMGRYEVTIGEWRKCVAAEKCRDLGKQQAANADDIPAYNITWDEAAAYADWLSSVTGRRFRLPTEAEWEFAARAGTKFAYSGSNTPEPEYVDCKDCGPPHKNKVPRGEDLQPNAFGLAGMSGGVAEWTADCWKPNYQDHPADQSAVELPNCTKRVLRGGSWRDDRRRVTVTSRAFYDRDVAYPNNGFRLAEDR